MRSTTFAALVLTLAAAVVAPVGAASPIFTLEDPARDDYGDGTLRYPLSPLLAEGDLDLVSFSAEASEKGTWFEVTFRRPVRAPGPQVVDALGTTAEQRARLGFYAFNVDVYIDTDRVEGSGRTHTLPGRKLTIDAKTGWEKVVSLSPRPDQSSLLVRQQMNRDAKEAARSDKARVDDADLAAAREKVAVELEGSHYFANRVQVSGKTVRFFVPTSFLGGLARTEWAYAVVVTGALLESRPDTTSLLGKAGVPNDFLVLPVGTGLGADHFAGREDDPLQSPAVDVLVAADQKQEEALRDYDLRSGRLAQIRGAVPHP